MCWTTSQLSILNVGAHTSYCVSWDSVLTIVRIKILRAIRQGVLLTVNYIQKVFWLLMLPYKFKCIVKLISNMTIFNQIVCCVLLHSLYPSDGITSTEVQAIIWKMFYVYWTQIILFFIHFKLEIASAIAATIKGKILTNNAKVDWLTNILLQITFFYQNQAIELPIWLNYGNCEWIKLYSFVKMFAWLLLINVIDVDFIIVILFIFQILPKHQSALMFTI